jgi:hypothetical protein
MLTETQFQDIHERFLSSGLTIRSFCLNEGICEAKFYYWRSKLKRLLPGTNGFVPILINHSGCPSTLPGVNTKDSARSASNGICFEVCYPNGTSLKLEGSVDLRLLRSLITLNP